MFRKRIAPLLIAVVAAMTLGACGDNPPPAEPTGSYFSDAGGEIPPDETVKTIVPIMQYALEAAKFTNVKVTTEMEEEGGKRFAVVSAVVGLKELKSNCALNYETKAPFAPYFDEVITPEKPDGIEVKGAARKDPTPKGALNYVLKNHPACLVPGAKVPKK